MTKNTCVVNLFTPTYVFIVLWLFYRMIANQLSFIMAPSIFILFCLFWNMICIYGPKTVFGTFFNFISLSFSELVKNYENCDNYNDIATKNLNLSKFPFLRWGHFWMPLTISPKNRWINSKANDGLVLAQYIISP